MSVGKKESLEKWLDNMIEAHEPIWENIDFRCEEENNTGIYVSGSNKSLLVKGVVRVAEILGCCITFKPTIGGSTMATIDYKGCELYDFIYN